VSTRDQHPESQHDALTAAGCDEIFLDKASGTLARRPELDKALLSANRTGDQIVITKLDRLGRSLEHLLELSKQLQDRGVDLVVLDQGINTPPPSAACSFKSSVPSPSTPSCPNAPPTDSPPPARGRTGGQKPKLGPRQVALAQQMYDETDNKGVNARTPWRRSPPNSGSPGPTIYRHLSKTAALSADPKPPEAGAPSTGWDACTGLGAPDGQALHTG